MKNFDVYPRYDIEPVKARGSWLWDENGEKYLDLYGGHAVISIGHSHPEYVRRIKEQVEQIGFYSNSVKMSIQDELATKLGEQSGYPDYQLFLCNSGAEANENAFKLASFHTGRKKIIVFERGFHGRTSLVVEATDNKKIQAPINDTGNILRLPWNDVKAFEEVIDESIAGVVLEGIQGISGIYLPDDHFISAISKGCKKHGALLILDEIQSGYGRSGKFFAHQYYDVRPDIISMAKGMGNGFPIGGILISPEIEPWAGMLGTTFGGNHLACAAGIAVLDVIKKEKLVDNAKTIGQYLMSELGKLNGVSEIRGRGLMVGIDLPVEAKSVRSKLLLDHHIFTGSSSNAHTLRLLPPLNITREELDIFLGSIKKVLSEELAISN
ncbi:MAG: aspartate aminotransferase family protein [Cyclobacteriaceae bacterium]|nr:aspartate aminotransferase family protein [Cyclobacteriaceae bacterium HetDA_MAG_MS6]